MHYYAFYYNETCPREKGVPIYDRTFGTKDAAMKWVAKDKNRFFTINCLPKESWY